MCASCLPLFCSVFFPWHWLLVKGRPDIVKDAPHPGIVHPPLFHLQLVPRWAWTWLFSELVVLVKGLLVTFSAIKGWRMPWGPRGAWTEDGLWGRGTTVTSEGAQRPRAGEGTWIIPDPCPPCHLPALLQPTVLSQIAGPFPPHLLYLLTSGPEKALGTRWLLLYLCPGSVWILD